MIIGLAIGLLLMPLLARKFKGKTFSEGMSYSIELFTDLIVFILKGIKNLVGLFFSKKKTLPEK